MKYYIFTKGKDGYLYPAMSGFFAGITGENYKDAAGAIKELWLREHKADKFSDKYVLLFDLLGDE